MIDRGCGLVCLCDVMGCSHPRHYFLYCNLGGKIGVDMRCETKENLDRLAFGYSRRDSGLPQAAIVDNCR